MPADHTGHRARMRERFRASGLDGFAPHEVLELILFYAIPQRNVNPLAHRLLDTFGSLHGVLDAPVEELQKVEGVGEYAATLLSLFSQTARRIQQSRQSQLTPVTNRGQAEAHCLALLSSLRQERFYAVCLNGQMQCLGDALIATGSISEVPAYPRLVAEAALRYNAHSVVLCHNHPGGSLVPSRQDMEITRRLAQVLEGIEVRLADHIIVAGGQALSMVAYGLIQQQAVPTGVSTRVADSSGETLIRARLQKTLKGNNV